MTEDLDPSQFYTGVVADIYRHLRGEDPDSSVYERFVRRHGEPALELGCGDGDPLLDLVAAGLHVEGLDASADMLERCRAAAAARDLEVTLHHGRFESMDLGCTFRTIYVAGATLNLIPDDEGVQAALAAIARHLDPDGAALVTFWVPPPRPAPPDFVRSVTLPDGTWMRVSAIGGSRDEQRRHDVTLLRYELERDGHTETADRAWLIHWVPADDLRVMVAQAGLTVRRAVASDGSPMTTDTEEFTFVLALATS